jgi:hypothetical protein
MVAELSVFAVKGAALCQLLLSNGFYPWQGWNVCHALAGHKDVLECRHHIYDLSPFINV